MELNYIIEYLIEALANIDIYVIYLLILGFMTIESSFIPFPSEAVLVPAGAIAGIYGLKLWLVILLAIIGSVIGALINYYIGSKVGDRIMNKQKKWLFIKPKYIDKTKKYFSNYGDITIFISRLVPVVRQYISIPAGIVKMKLSKFIIYTALGAGIWVVFLTYIGYSAGIWLLESSISYINLIGILILIIGIIYVALKELRKWT